MFEDNTDLKTRIKILIKESEYLIGKNEISKEEFRKFTTRTNRILTEIIQSDLENDIKKNAYKALKPYNGKSKLDFFPFNLFYKLFLHKMAWDHNMPFFVGKKKSNKLKSKIPKIKIQLEAIDFKMDNLKS